jgi:multidrug resistance efflux pump
LISSHIPLLLAFACLAITPARGQQQGPSNLQEYKATVVAALEGEVAPRVDGLLTTINFTAGQFVKKGDLLFEFGSRSQELSLALAQAALKQAEAQLRLAEVQLKNAQTLRTRNVASEMRLLEAEAHETSRQARLTKRGPMFSSPSFN